MVDTKEMKMKGVGGMAPLEIPRSAMARGMATAQPRTMPLGTPVLELVDARENAPVKGDTANHDMRNGAAVPNRATTSRASIRPKTVATVTSRGYRARGSHSASRCCPSAAPSCKRKKSENYPAWTISAL